MKQLSIIIAVAMAIFATACSNAVTIKMQNDHAIVYVKDQTVAKSTDFLSVSSGDGTSIIVKSDAGEIHLNVEENYNLNEYSGSRIKLSGQIFDLLPLTGFVVYKDEVHPVQALSIDTSFHSLSIASVPNENCTIISTDHGILSDTNGKEIPFMYVAYKEGGALKMIYIPVLRPQQRIWSDTDNVFELYLDGKLKCLRAV